jgi:hypothetical protein
LQSPKNMWSTFRAQSSTPHPCDDGSHSCDQGEGGVCYKADDGSDGWTCGCASGYRCVSGCDGVTDDDVDASSSDGNVWSVSI